MERQNTDSKKCKDIERRKKKEHIQKKKNSVDKPNERAYVERKREKEHIAEEEGKKLLKIETIQIGKKEIFKQLKVTISIAQGNM